MKTWQLFYCELKDDGTWWHGKRPLKVLFDKPKAERYFKWLKRNASINQDYIMVEPQGFDKPQFIS